MIRFLCLFLTATSTSAAIGAIQVLEMRDVDRECPLTMASVELVCAMVFVVTLCLVLCLMQSDRCDAKKLNLQGSRR